MFFALAFALAGTNGCDCSRCHAVEAGGSVTPASVTARFLKGTAKTLRDVVRHYSEQCGFNFTAAEEDDLTAFMRAL